MKLEVKLEIEVELSPYSFPFGIQEVRKVMGAENLHEIINGYLDQYCLVSKLKKRKGGTA